VSHKRPVKDPISGGFDASEPVLNWDRLLAQVREISPPAVKNQNHRGGAERQLSFHFSASKELGQSTLAACLFTELSPGQHIQMAALLYGKAEETKDERRKQDRILLANSHLDMATKLIKHEGPSRANQRSQDRNLRLFGRAVQKNMTDPSRGRDYFAEYHAAIDTYRKEIEKVFGFAFRPEYDERGKDAVPGSALRKAYDAMVEARRERDDRHPPGTWIG
jgi:hypothetical protein